jgi:DNA-binding NarL/FixJ family response regulator
MRHVAEPPSWPRARSWGPCTSRQVTRTRGFAAGDLRLAEAVAGLLALAIDRIRTGERAARELEQARAALDLAGTAVVVSDPRSPDLRLNAAARRLVQEIDDADECVHELLAFATGDGRFSSRVEVCLTNGATGVVHAHSARILTGELMTGLELQREHPRVDRRLLQPLTHRECQVATLVVEGLSDREIAEQLSLSHYTVSQHLARVYRKLGVDSRVVLTRPLLAAPAGVRRG